MESQITNILFINNPFTQEQVTEGLLSWPKNIRDCVKRTATFTQLRNRFHKTLPDKAFKDFKTIESCVTELEPLLREPTEIEKEGYSQIYFKDTPLTALNAIPFALVILSMYKSYIVPAFGVLLPLLSWILPYILLKAFYNVPITFTEYTTLMWRMWNGQMPRNPLELVEPQEQPQPDPITQMKTIAQNAWTIFTVGQAVWQPIQQARHFIRLDTDCLKLGDSIVRVKEVGMNLWNEWSPWLPKWLGNWLDICPENGRQAFAFVMDTPFWLRHTFRALGRLEILMRLAARSDVVPAQFVGGTEPVLMLKDFGDPAIPIDSRILSSVKLGGGGEKHSILTGPNRGGKSSFLRGIILNVALAHTFGAAFAGAAQMTPFTWIADGMRLDDTPGEQSMFEREVAFGSAVLRKEGGLGLILYDELFHSTNPPDATRTSQIFCDSLWKKENCLSVVSTHVYNLAREAPKSVKKLCVAAWRSPKGKFKFSYAIQRGVCEISSVDLLLKQFGMRL